MYGKLAGRDSQIAENLNVDIPLLARTDSLKNF